MDVPLEDVTTEVAQSLEQCRRRSVDANLHLEVSGLHREGHVPHDTAILDEGHTVARDLHLS